jgi:hypothetical protein
LALWSAAGMTGGNQQADPAGNRSACVGDRLGGSTVAISVPSRCSR